MTPHVEPMTPKAPPWATAEATKRMARPPLRTKAGPAKRVRQRPRLPIRSSTVAMASPAPSPSTRERWPRWTAADMTPPSAATTNHRARRSAALRRILVFATPLKVLVAGNAGSVDLLTAAPRHRERGAPCAAVRSSSSRLASLAAPRLRLAWTMQTASAWPAATNLAKPPRAPANRIADRPELRTSRRRHVFRRPAKRNAPMPAYRAPIALAPVAWRR